MYFFDSYALIEVIKASSTYDKLRQSAIITNALNIAETHFFLLERFPESQANKMIEGLNSKLLEITQDIAMAAASFRFHNKKLKLSYADCIGYCLAQAKHLTFVTGDDAFKGMDGVEFLK